MIRAYMKTNKEPATKVVHSLPGDAANHAQQQEGT